MDYIHIPVFRVSGEIARVAQWLMHLSCKEEIVSSILTSSFFAIFFIFFFFCHARQIVMSVV